MWGREGSVRDCAADPTERCAAKTGVATLSRAKLATVGPQPPSLTDPSRPLRSNLVWMAGRRTVSRMGRSRGLSQGGHPPNMPSFRVIVRSIVDQASVIMGAVRYGRE